MSDQKSGRPLPGVTGPPINGVPRPVDSRVNRSQTIPTAFERASPFSPRKAILKSSQNQDDVKIPKTSSGTTPSSSNTSDQSYDDIGSRSSKSKSRSRTGSRSRSRSRSGNESIHNTCSTSPIVSSIILNQKNNYKIFCPCQNLILSFSEWAPHFCSVKHQEWFIQSPLEINKINIKCGCGISYNYQNGHDHFRSKNHKAWQVQDPNRYDDVLIVCKCGDVIRYKDRPVHNRIHRMPIYQKA